MEIDVRMRTNMWMTRGVLLGSRSLIRRSKSRMVTNVPIDAPAYG
jgi:hypothetical protein